MIYHWVKYMKYNMLQGRDGSKKDTCRPADMETNYKAILVGKVLKVDILVAFFAGSFPDIPITIGYE